MYKMKKHITILAALFCLLHMSQSAYGQWGFTATLSYSGSCAGYGTSYSFPISGLSTKSQCESIRNMLLDIRVSVDGCSVYYRCTSCTGSDIASFQSGSVSIVGTETGTAYFSPNQYQSSEDWINDIWLKQQALDLHNASDNDFTFLSSDNAEFDKTYQNLANGVTIDPDSKVKIFDQPSFDYSINTEKFMQIDRYEQQMESILEELNQIERFCAASSSGCEYYQKRKNELEQELKYTTDELIKIKEEDYESELKKYDQEKEMYSQQLSDCKNAFCRNDIQKALDNVNAKISDISNDIENLTKNGLKDEITKIEQNIDEKIANMSDAEKKCEIAYKMIESGNEAEGNRLLETYAPIVATEDAYKEVSSFVVEKVDIAKEGIGTTIDMVTGKYDYDESVEKYQTLVISDIYKIASTTSVPGSTFMGMLGDAARQNIETGSINTETVTGVVLKQGIKTAINKSPYEPVISVLKKGINVGKAGISASNFIEDVGNLYIVTSVARESERRDK